MAHGGAPERELPAERGLLVGAFPSEVVRVIASLLAPFVMLFGLYVTAHGHYGPGGGFGGGVLIAVGPVMLKVAYPGAAVARRLPGGLVLAVALLGFGAFVLIGLAPMLFGGAFLDYAAVPIGELATSRLRYLGILAVELVIGIAVAGTILAIFDAVTEGGS